MEHGWEEGLSDSQMSDCNQVRRMGSYARRAEYDDRFRHDETSAGRVLQVRVDVVNRVIGMTSDAWGLGPAAARIPPEHQGTGSASLPVNLFSEFVFRRTNEVSRLRLLRLCHFE